MMDPTEAVKVEYIVYFSIDNRCDKFVKSRRSLFAPDFVCQLDLLGIETGPTKLGRFLG